MIYTRKFVIQFTYINNHNRQKASVWGKPTRDKSYTFCKIYPNPGKGNVVDLLPIVHEQSTCAVTDNFSKKAGRLIAFRRAVSDKVFTKEDRKELWEAFKMILARNPIHHEVWVG